MPPWLSDPEAVAGFIAALFALLAAVVTGLGGLIAAGVYVWRTKFKPILTSTRTAAESAAEQLTPNHGSSARDSLGRIENTVDRLDRSMNQRLTEVRADLRTHVEHSDRQHSEIFRRMHTLESPMEDPRS